MESHHSILIERTNKNLFQTISIDVVSGFAGHWSFLNGCNIYSAEGIGISLPFLIAWMMSPAIAWKISLPDKGKMVDLDETQKLFLHKLARKTWAFFETFVVAGDNWLPPDNYQESPVERIAHRTSPTNIGLSLLSNLTAFDFGYIPMQILLIRVSNTMQTLQKMESIRDIFITGMTPKPSSHFHLIIFPRLTVEIWPVI